MVFINDQKFACESCIKGHRSSSCNHTNRPLFEIKGKGRPVSQCQKCRELRKSKKVHSKCLCNSAGDLNNASSSSAQTPSSRKKTSRFVPITPSLPNGISDAVLSYGSSSFPTHSKQRIESLLNPCLCKSLRKCHCRKQPEHSCLNTLPSIPVNATPGNGLAALADAAVLYLPGQSSSPEPSLITVTSKNPLTSRTKPARISKRQLSRPSTPLNRYYKRRKYIPANQQGSAPGPSLPPILTSPSSSSTPSHQVPDFPLIPPISIMASIAGSGCTCGLFCACPDCAEHRKDEHTSTNGGQCGNACRTCVDWQGGIGLPATNQLTGGQSKSIVNQFYARAAALPLPPLTRNRSTGVKIDPMNVLVYPSDLFSNSNLKGNSSSNNDGWAFSLEGREVAFGLVKVPKLECCGGRCSCPDDDCSCGESCDGRCGDHGHNSSDRHGSITRPLVSDVQGLSLAASPSSNSNRITSRSLSPTVPIRSCCAKRRTTNT